MATATATHDMLTSGEAAIALGLRDWQLCRLFARGQAVRGPRPVLPLGGTRMSAGTGCPVKVPVGKFSPAEAARRLSLYLRRERVSKPAVISRAEIEADVRRAPAAGGEPVAGTIPRGCDADPGGSGDEAGALAADGEALFGG
jgi:hypothetical protein